MSYLEYINKLSELKQTIVGYGDALSTLVKLFVLLGTLALMTIVFAALATIIAVVVDWFVEKLMNVTSRLLKESIGINSDVLFMLTVMVGILGSLAILNSVDFMSTHSTETTKKPMTHSDSIVQLHNDLVNWNDSDFDELWNATVKYKLMKSDDEEYHEVVKVIKEAKRDRDKLKE